MIASVINNDARRFAEHLARLHPKDQAEAMMNAVIGADGVYQRQTAASTGPSLFTLNYLDIQASGITEFSAIQCWIRKARKASAPLNTQKKVFAA